MSSDKPASQLRLRVFGGPNGIGVRKNYIIAKTPLKNRWSTPKPSVAIATMCVRLHNDGPAHGRGGPSYFCLGKSNQNRVRRNASLRCRPLPTKPGKTLGCNYFAGLPCRFNTLYAKIFRELFVFQRPSRGASRFAMPCPLHHLAGFPRFLSEALLRTINS